MSQKDINNIKFYLGVTVLFLIIVFGFIWLESSVQNRWEKYEQKVFAEYMVE